MSNPHPHGTQPVLTAGTDLAEAQAALILVHGRGASAQSILPLAAELVNADAPFAFLAPQAQGSTWYPNSFLAPMEQNEPKLSSALQAVDALVHKVIESGIPAEKIVIGGFSQGACLASEYVARNARRYGGVVVFSGGVIGPQGTPRHYEGSLDGTPVFIGCSDVDFHIPVERVHETTETLRNLGAEVNEQIYPGMAHTIIQDEIDHARKVVASVLSS